MQPNCSGGTTDVFINGRNIDWRELSYLQSVIRAPIPQGRYALDANGWAGPEGGQKRFNLFDLILLHHQKVGGPVGGKITKGIIDTSGEAFVCVGAGECVSTPN